MTSNPAWRRNISALRRIVLLSSMTRTFIDPAVASGTCRPRYIRHAGLLCLRIRPLVRLFEVAEYPPAGTDQKTKVTRPMTKFVNAAPVAEHVPTRSAIRIRRGGSHIGHGVAWQIAHRGLR